MSRRNGKQANREHIALGLDLLDRQLLDRNDGPSGKVDDLLFEWPQDPDSGAAPYVTHILVGPGALGPRLHGVIGRWMYAVWRRLHPTENPEPIQIGFAAIAKIDYAVHLNLDRKDAGLTRSEDWVREHIIGRIPGA